MYINISYKDLSPRINNVSFESNSKKLEWLVDGNPHLYPLDRVLYNIAISHGIVTGSVFTLYSNANSIVSIDLLDELSLTTANTGNVTFTGDGTADKPLSADVRINDKQFVDNNGTLELSDNMFNVEIQDAFGKPLGYATKETFKSK